MALHGILWGEAHSGRLHGFTIRLSNNLWRIREGFDPLEFSIAPAACTGEAGRFLRRKIRKLSAKTGRGISGERACSPCPPACQSLFDRLLRHERTGKDGKMSSAIFAAMLFTSLCRALLPPAFREAPDLSQATMGGASQLLFPFIRIWSPAFRTLPASAAKSMYVRPALG